MDLFIAKGPKALHRFGLACLDSQLGRLLESGSMGDPAEGLKVLRTVAATAVVDRGVEALILASVTKFKFVNNRLLADLARFGKVHGGAQLVFVTDREGLTSKKSWLIVPAAEPALHEECVDRAPKDRLKKFSFLSKFRKSSKNNDHSSDKSPPADGLLHAAAESTADTPAASGTTSPSRRKHGRRKKHGEEKSNEGTFKNFRKKLGSLLPGSATRGYAKTGASDNF